jgi:hypothetical protein
MAVGSRVPLVVPGRRREPPYLLMHAPLHSLLVSCSRVLQAEGHGDIVVGSVRVMNNVLI